ncbi:zinc finger protein [Amycolatopsis sp. NEAU-NG30]|uniref:Zinc finger protein n=1 Tax=Amycolatopsis melonis TaxID=3156488 RepID=A0ABV0LR25_9PSEU
MTAVIYIDFEAIHPVIDGEWHRTRLTGIPKPGQGITMLCGATATAVFQPLNRRRDRGVATACPQCDAIYRRERGIPQQSTRQGR